MSAAVPINGVNHLVLQVRNLDRSVAFYTELFGLREEIARFPGPPVMAFLSIPGGKWHALGLVDVGEDAPQAPVGAVGLFHFAFEVQRIGDLIEARDRLIERGLLIREHDHGATKSIYGRDPDGHNFEVMWEVPAEQWGRWAHVVDRMPLDLGQELARWG